MLDIKNSFEYLFGEHTFTSLYYRFFFGEKIVQENENATAYWAYIIHKNYKSDDAIWEKKNYENNERIRRISCDKVYELVTGDPHALKKTFRAIPIAINDILGTKKEFSKEDKKIIKEYEDHIFDD